MTNVLIPSVIVVEELVIAKAGDGERSPQRLACLPRLVQLARLSVRCRKMLQCSFHLRPRGSDLLERFDGTFVSAGVVECNTCKQLESGSRRGIEQERLINCCGGLLQLT